MRIKRTGLVAAGVGALGLLGTACQPPIDLTSFGVSRFGEVSADGHFVTLRGNVSCSRPGTVDLFLTIGDFSPSTAPNISCEGPDGNSWARTFQDNTATVNKGSVRITIQAALSEPNTGEENDDVVDLSRTVELS
jgi:hypothetical protein